MKVVVSSYECAYAAHLAHALRGREELGELFAGRRAPSGGWDAEGAGPAAGPPEGRLPRFLARLRDLPGAFDRRTAARLAAGPEAFLGSAGAALLSLRRARELSLAPLLACGTAHALYRHEVLRRAGVPPGVAGAPGARRIERELREAREAARVLVPSSFVRRTFLAAGVAEERILVLPPEVPLAGFAPAPEPPRGLHVVHVGPLSVRMGTHLLLRAFAELALPNATLRLVGPLEPSLRPHLERWGTRAVTLEHPRSEEEVARALRGATLFCRPSLDEGFAPRLLQAMACGLAVLASDASGAEDLLEGQEGAVVPAGELEPLEEELSAAARDEELVRARGAAALRRASAPRAGPDGGELLATACAAALAEERAGAEAALLRQGWRRVA